MKVTIPDQENTVTEMELLDQKEGDQIDLGLPSFHPPSIDQKQDSSHRHTKNSKQF